MNIASSNTTRSWALWSTSLGFSLLILATHQVFDSRELLVALVPLGAVHLYVCARFVDTISLELFVTQSIVALSTMIAVVMHSARSVGGYPEGGWSMVKSFAASSVSQVSTYSYLGLYSLAICAVVGCLMWAIRATGVHREVSVVNLFILAFATNTAAMPISYCFFQPLRHVGGEPDAVAFFFAAGVFGLELSGALYLLLFISGLVMSRFLRPTPK